MNLENQVISLDLSKKLKELNVKQESLFYWHHGIKQSPSCAEDIRLLDNNENMSDGRYIYEVYSAFTLLELLNLLPTINGFEPQLIRGHLMMEAKLKYCCRYGWEDDQNKYFVDIKPENSCAKMLIYLLENGLMKNE